MISPTKAYNCNGILYPSLEEAQVAELADLIRGDDANIQNAPQVAKRLLESSKQVIDILTTTEKSRPRARSVHGGKKKRNKTAQPELPMQQTAGAKRSVLMWTSSTP